MAHILVCQKTLSSLYLKEAQYRINPMKKSSKPSEKPQKGINQSAIRVLALRRQNRENGHKPLFQPKGPLM